MTSYLDIGIVVGFLVITMVVGMGHGRKVANIRDYALGGRNFSTGALVATIVATSASGSGFFITLSETYANGFGYLFFVSVGVFMEVMITSLILAPRMGEFLGKVSVAQAMGDIYGSKVRLITAIAGTIGSIGGIAVQFKVFGDVVAYFTKINPAVAIIGAGVMTTMYSAFGGIRSVTFTDIFQGFTFGLIIPLLGFLIWSQFYNTEYLLSNAFSSPKFSLSYIFSTSNGSFWNSILLLVYFCIPTVSSPMFQRISMGSSISQVKKAFFIAAVLLLVADLLIAWIPFLLHIIDSDIAEKDLLGYTVNKFSFAGLNGLVLTAVIAFAMSTADSFINSSSVLFTNDIYGLLNKKANRKNELFVARVFAFVLGFGAIALSLIGTELLGMIVFTNSFYFPLVVPPLLLTIFGFRSSARPVLTGMFVGFIITVFWKFLPGNLFSVSQDIIGVLVAMSCNVIALFTSHYLLGEPGGWVGIKDRSYLDEQRTLRAKRSDAFFKDISVFTIRELCRKIAPKSDATYTTLGMYFIVCTITTMYSTQVELRGENAQLMKIIYPFMLVSGTTMSMYQIWPLSVPDWIKKAIIETWYPFAVFYMLVFFSCFFVLVSGFAMLQVALFIINLMIVCLLFGWRLSLFAIIVGFYASVKSYEHFFDNYGFAVQFGSPEFVLIYVMVFFALAVIIFFKPKEELEKKKDKTIDSLKEEIDYARRELENISQGYSILEEQFQKQEGNLKEKEQYLKDQLRLRNDEVARLIDMKDEFLRNIMHESNTPMVGVITLSDVLYDCYDQLDSSTIKDTIKQIINSSDRLKTYVDNIVDLSKLSKGEEKLNKEEVDLGLLAKERTFLYKKIFSDDAAKQEFRFEIEANVIANCDKYYITQAMDNLISNAVQYGKNRPVRIVVKNYDEETVEFSIIDRGIGIPKIDLYRIFSKFEVSSRTRTQAGGRGVGLALCKSCIEAHNGEIFATSSREDGTKFTFIIPKL
jgi:Na+/proline symporter/signal transduction histidine kinase